MTLDYPQMQPQQPGLLLKILAGFLFFPLSVIFLSLTAQAQNLHQWGNISLFHGLPSAQVNAIAQTPDGMFWFGTENGLAKFDGRRVQTIPLEQVTQIFSVSVGKDGKLFVGTNNGLFYSLNNNILPVEATRGQRINSLFAGEKILFATQQGQVAELQDGAVREILALDVPVNSLYLKGDILFLGTEGRGLLRFENGTLKAAKNLSQPFFINDLDDDKSFNLWLGSRAKPRESGVFRADFQGIGEQLGEVKSLKFNEKNELWIGTKHKGVYLFREGSEIAHYTFENTSGGLLSNQIFDVFLDREGVIWFGTDKGVCRFDAASPFNYLFSEASGDNLVRVLYQAANGKIYAGTNQGLFVSDGEKWTEVSEFSGKSIYSIGEDSEKKIVVGTPADQIRAVKSLNGKTYSAIFGKGLLENEKLIFANDNIISAFVEKEKIYLGTVKDGVWEFSNGEIRPLNILRDNAVREISGTLEKGLWFASEKGLFHWQNGTIKAVIENIEFRSVLLKNDKVFAGSLNKGLFQAKFDKNFGWVFSNLNVEQGLPSSVIFALLPFENSLLIGTGKGISRYSPDELAPSIAPNRIISERIHTFPEITEGISLDYPQNTLTVEVTGLSSRTFPESFQYAYLLKNSRGEEILKKLTRDSQISFESLQPDSYTAEIRTFHQDLLASEPFSFKFSVAKVPFPWTSTALGILLLIALIALTIAIFERRQISAKNREIAAARFDLANEAERERRRIARDLHDQTLADLRKLMLESDNLESETTEFRREIEAVSHEIRRICEDLSPSVLENVGLTAALEFLLGRTTPNYKFSSSDGLEEKLNFPANVQMQIYRIAQEILNNIKRHAEANFVEMKIFEENGFQMIIENDGKQFLPNREDFPKGRGISNIKARAELIEAHVFWRNNEEGKTIFILQKNI